MGVGAQANALRVLIVDDNRQFLAAASDVLERDGATVVGLASTSAEALRLTDELQPDVVLVDIDLGDESGFELAKRLAAAAGARVVLISVYPESELAELVAASPAVGFLSKSELSATTIANVLRNRRGRGN